MVELGDHCETHIAARMRKIADGIDAGGVTESAVWKGGGGFRYYRLAPSLLDKDPWGNWVISKSYDAAKLSQAVCKLMGFVYRPSETHYWMQGRSSETDFIYVTTQSLTHEQLVALSEAVGDERTLLVCCKAFRANADAFPISLLKSCPRPFCASANGVMTITASMWQTSPRRRARVSRMTCLRLQRWQRRRPRKALIRTTCLVREKGSDRPNRPYHQPAPFASQAAV